MEISLVQASSGKFLSYLLISSFIHFQLPVYTCGYMACGSHFPHRRVFTYNRMLPTPEDTWFLDLLSLSPFPSWLCPWKSAFFSNPGVFPSWFFFYFFFSLSTSHQSPLNSSSLSLSSLLAKLAQLKCIISFLWLVLHDSRVHLNIRIEVWNICCFTSECVTSPSSSLYPSAPLFPILNFLPLSHSYFLN